MAKIQLPPKREESAQTNMPAPAVDEKKILEIIKKGGSPIKKEEKEEGAESFKNFNVKLLDTELQDINELREKRPRQRGQKRLGISLHDWIVEAIQEKIEREKKKYEL